MYRSQLARRGIPSLQELRTAKDRTRIAGVVVSLMFSCACHQPAVRTPPAPRPISSDHPSTLEKPTIAYFDADPSIITAGQSLSLRWSVENTTSVEISPGLGSVKPTDTTVVSPKQSTTYVLLASNAGGRAEASVTVTVSRPQRHQTQENEEAESSISVLTAQLRDVHFDYNEDKLRAEDLAVLKSDADLLQNLFQLDPEARVTIEGHCDDRGSDEYNFALGDRRARAVKEAIADLGVAAEKLEIISFGKDHPLCTTTDEECYARNRRVHFSASGMAGAPH